MDINDLIPHLKQDHPDLKGEEFMVFLSNYLNIIESPSDLKEIKDSAEVAMEIKISATKVWTYPPLDFYSCIDDSEEEGYEKGLFERLVDLEVVICKGYFILNEFKNTKDALEKFNDIASIFNILGVPIDFFNMTDIISLGHTPKGITLEMVCSNMAYRRNSKVPLVVLNQEDLRALLGQSNKLWEKIKETDFLIDTKIYEFLGRARLSFFNSNFRLAFINGWIVIEAIIREIWEIKIIEKYDSKSITKDMRRDHRNWTTSVITEELYLIDGISLDDVKEIRYLRKKRNNLFHFKSPEKSKVSEEDANRCISMGFRFLTRVLKDFEGEDIGDLESIRQKIYKAIHKGGRFE